MIAPELFHLNLVRGRGLFARAVMKAQLASPGFTPVFAALVAVVNTKLPENGELILKRVIVAFRRAYKRRDKVVATALAKFVAHMVNQQVRWITFFFVLVLEHTSCNKKHENMSGIAVTARRSQTHAKE